MFPSLLMWSIDLAAPPASSPSAAGGVVAVPLQSGEVAAWRVSSGEHTWSAKLKVAGPMAAGDDRFVVYSAGALHALAAPSGAALWRVESAPLTAPVVVQGGWLLAATDKELSALRLSDGVVVWTRALERIERRPAVDGERLYVSASDGRVIALDLSTGSVLWERTLAAPLTEPLAIADRIYVGAGHDFLCLRSASGDEDWRWDKIGAPIVGAAAVDADHVYMTAMDNLVRALDRISGNARWKADLGYRPETGPIVIGSTVIVTGRATAIRGFDAKTGKPAVQIALPDQMVVQPTFFRAPEGRQMVAAVTANLKGENRLSIGGSVTPFVPIVPLRNLPGSVLKAGLPEPHTPHL